jgi:hypothetical protein
MAQPHHQSPTHRFNNHPATTMAEVRKVLEVALERSAAEARSNKPE